MKNSKMNFLVKTFLFGLVFMTFLSCERDLSDEATDATFSKTGAIFLDAPVEMGSDFYFPYGGSKPNAWSVDDQVSYKGSASMRFDVPNANDPEGSYAGAIFRTEGAGRNLTDYDALTFYVKASQGVVIGEFGFGEDFIDNKYIATIRNVSIGTNWTKIIIPIPDASKLVKERGMFRYAAGSQGTNGFGYTFWIDELKFEKLGNILNGQASIMNGQNVTQNTFVNVTSTVDNVVVNFNLPTGINQAVFVSPAYMNFSSSDTTVATVNDAGVVTSLSAGTAVITATFNGVQATGSLTINCAGTFVNAPVPTRNQANVISIFSDAYSNVPVNYYNGYWQPWQTTVSNDFSVNGDNILNYTIFNFVGIEFSSPTVNATNMTHFHADFFFPGPIAPGRQLRVIVVDFGPNGVFSGGDDTRHSTTFTAPTLVSNSWVSIDIPFSAMPGLASRQNLAQIIFEGGDGSIMYVDNVYFYN
ncbi:glycosyl hydrolase family 16 [Flavobacterium filum]|uniref:glycosyl hydrolase family 16 n=1 Tax=Flavobacterium filum TaxID=370974 RepID=UPI000401782B|nr:glycosyl hydrolase family 16 [Flavobacterium filum]